jgi:hypothetical protein
MYCRPLPITVGGGRHLSFPDLRAGVAKFFHTGVAISLTPKIIPALMFSGTAPTGGWDRAR